jgi:N-methylhydantoinase A
VASEEFEPAFVSLGITVIGAVARSATLAAGKVAASSSKRAGANNSLKGERDVIFDGKPLKTRVYDAGRLQAGNTIEGPAIVEHEHSCTVLPPGSQASIDAALNLIIKV